MSNRYYVEHLRYITAVTDALNTLPESDGLYIRVELREEGTDRVVGKWSDEVAPDCWSYEEVDT